MVSPIPGCHVLGDLSTGFQALTWWFRVRLQPIDLATQIELYAELFTSTVCWVELLCSSFNLRPLQQRNGCELHWSLTLARAQCQFSQLSQAVASNNRSNSADFCSDSPERVHASAAPHRASATRRVARMRRRLLWVRFLLANRTVAYSASVCLTDAAPLRVPPPHSESTVALWLFFTPHPPTGFGLQGFSHPGSRALSSAVAHLSLKPAVVSHRPLL